MTLMLNLLFTFCKKERLDEVFFEEDELLISAYLEEHKETYSTLLRVLDITGLKSTLGAYGHYTFFAPDNTAFDAFISNQGMASIEDFDVTYRSTLVKYQLLDVAMFSGSTLTIPGLSRSL